MFTFIAAVYNLVRVRNLRPVTRSFSVSDYVPEPAPTHFHNNPRSKITAE